MSDLPSSADILSFAKLNGAYELHRSWRDNMLAQGREVSEERMKWETLSEEDKVLDFKIAHDLYQDFYTWLRAHYLEEHPELTDNDLIRGDR